MGKFGDYSPAAGLDGTEVVVIKQAGATVRTTTGAIAAQLGASGGSDILDLNTAGVALETSLATAAVGVPGQVTALHAQRDVARVSGKSLTGFGTFQADAPIDLTVVDLRLPRVVFKAVPNLAALLGGAPALKIGGLWSSSYMTASKSVVWNGNRANQTTAFTAVEIAGDRAPGSRYVVAGGNHKGDYVLITDDCEKKDIAVYANGVTDGYAVSVIDDGNGSPDEINLFVDASDCDAFYRDEGSTSVQVTFNVERTNVGTTLWGALIQAEKAIVIKPGEIRALNGRGVRVFRPTGKAGAVVMCNPLLIHARQFCVLDIVNPRELTGEWTSNDVGNSSGDGGQVHWVRSVEGLCDFKLNAEDCYGPIGFQGGDSGTSTGQTRLLSGRIVLAVAMNATSQARGTDRLALLDNCQNFHLVVTKWTHHIELGANNSKVRIDVPAQGLRDGWTVIKHASASAVEVRIMGEVASTEILGLPWLFPGVVAENVTDWNCSARFGEDLRWHPLVMLPTNAAALGNSGGLFNRDLKFPGSTVFNEDDGLLYIAQGSTTLDHWKPSDGGTHIVPTGLAVTTALAARITATGAAAASGALLSAYDRLYSDLLDAGLIDLSDLTASWLKILYLAQVHDERVFMLNIASPAGTYDLTKSGTTVFTAKDCVQTNGSTGYYSTGWNPETTPLGTAHDDFSVGAFAEAGSGSDNGYGISAANGRTRYRGHLGSTGTAGTINQSGNVAASVPYATPVGGLVSRIPSEANTLKLFMAGALDAVNGASAPASTFANTLELLRSNGTYLQSSAKYSAFFAGKGADGAKAAALNAALVRFRAAARIA